MPRSESSWKELLAYAKSELAKVNNKQEDGRQEVVRRTRPALQGRERSKERPRGQEAASARRPDAGGEGHQEGPRTGRLDLGSGDWSVIEPMAQAVYNGQDDWKNGRKLAAGRNQINQKWRPENFHSRRRRDDLGKLPLNPGRPGVFERDRAARHLRSENQPWQPVTAARRARASTPGVGAVDRPAMKTRSRRARSSTASGNITLARALVKTANNFRGQRQQSRRTPRTAWTG